jgi:RNA recognition motif-containing protein
MEGCETLYVSNLNDRVKVEDLKSLVYELFAGFGEVISVQILRGKKNAKGQAIRGTAFVSFRSIPQAMAALRNLKDFPLLGKPIKIQYALTRSDEVTKLQGTYKLKATHKRKLVSE